MTYPQQLLNSAVRGLAIGIGFGLVTIAFVGLVMLATGNCKP